ncbi:oxidoreductase [Sistotremastrum suecicum HHB10207 ss-3]|uniref:Ceramide very long chain fatty acid hydroxylase n=1 Tax=Sistotremastrum suecicum HHB10207 ss-3 TaxID=1314776 RepID=A0A166GEC5_9AGAM|nr:oxidoreductase [Sistotremastrum suecicum HHB10207 ss-3]
MATTRNRSRIYAAEDIAQHTSRKDCWITRKGKVYDVTGFLDDHPGGDDLILKYGGKDVEEVMEDSNEHDHTDAAYDMMEEFVIGRLGTGETIVSDDWVATEDFHPDDTNTETDFEKCQFLDLRKPLLRQVWESNFSKAFYLQQVHQPRHLAQSARLFGPEYLEVFTRTSWYVIPTFWLPVVAYLFTRSALQFTGVYPSVFFIPRLADLALIPASSFSKTLMCFLFGNFVWTIIEYGMHRFLFHIDDWLPDSPYFLTAHFLTHGVHHYLPMDRLRLVMPPPLFIALSFPFTRLAYFLFGTPIANGVISGAFTFYILYDCMHYALHHTKLPAYLREMKKYHLAHHYKNFELGFGVTSKLWDVVFGTALVV